MTAVTIRRKTRLMDAVASIFSSLMQVDPVRSIALLHLYKRNTVPYLRPLQSSMINYGVRGIGGVSYGEYGHSAYGDRKFVDRSSRLVCRPFRSNETALVGWCHLDRTYGTVAAGVHAIEP